MTGPRRRAGHIITTLVLAAGCWMLILGAVDLIWLIGAQHYS